MTVNEIMAELRKMGHENIKKIFLNHGIKEPLFGVKIKDLKTIQKKIGKNYLLAKGLYATGNADAMYLAGLIADDAQMTKADLKDWVTRATSDNICDYIVPWVTAGSRDGFELAMEWIDDGKEHIAAAGWSTLGSLVALKPDHELNLESLKSLLKRVEKTIHSSPNRVRYAMNGFIISAGCYVKTLTEMAIATAKKIGPVTLDMNGIACKVPEAKDRIQKVKDKAAIGRKKKTVKC